MAESSLTTKYAHFLENNPENGRFDLHRRSLCKTLHENSFNFPLVGPMNRPAKNAAKNSFLVFYRIG